MFTENISATHPNAVNSRFEWKDRKRSLYLVLTDKVIWLIYLLFWTRMLKKLSGNQGK
jgi:hypothetical protein